MPIGTLNLYIVMLYLNALFYSFFDVLVYQKNNINEYINNTLIKRTNPFNIDPHFEKQYESFFYNNICLVDDLFKYEDFINQKNILEKS